MTATPDPRAQHRLIALGASNLTRGLGHLVAAARQQGPVELLAALGFGRSYGIASSVLFRTLPGIDDCGLWPAVAQAPPLPATGLVMDVGNDLLYGVDVDSILAWVERALQRLRPAVQRLAVLSLPGLQSIGRRRYTIFRTLLFPRCRIPLAEMLDKAEHLDDGLLQLAAQHGAVHLRTEPQWYGLDPVHIQRRHWPALAQRLLGTPAPVARPRFDRQLLLARPAQYERFGRPRGKPQPSAQWPDGSTLSLW